MAKRPIESSSDVRPLTEAEQKLSKQLVVSAEAELGKDGAVGVPQPPTPLFLVDEVLISLGISRKDIYYNSRRTFHKSDSLLVNEYFWHLVKDDLFDGDAATLIPAWCINIDPDGLPDYRDSQQVEHQYPPKLIGLIANKYPRIKESDFKLGASPLGINLVHSGLASYLEQATGQVVDVRRQRYMEYVIRGSVAHPEWVKIPTLQFFADQLKNGAYLCGRTSIADCGVPHLNSHPADYKSRYVGYSTIIEFRTPYDILTN